MFFMPEQLKHIYIHELEANCRNLKVQPITQRKDREKAEREGRSKLDPVDKSFSNYNNETSILIWGMTS